MENMKLNIEVEAPFDIIFSGGYLNPERVIWDRNHAAHQDYFKLEKYDPTWKIIANEEIKRIKGIIESEKIDNIIDIEHTGSTSIEGQDAKNCIDLMVGIKSEEDFVFVRRFLILCGYISNTNKGHYISDNLYCSRATEIDDIKEFKKQKRIFFFNNKVCPEKPLITLMLIKYGAPYWNSRIMFRDYMNSNKEYINSYRSLKEKLISSHISFDEYVIGKQDFIEMILKKAGASKEIIMDSCSYKFSKTFRFLTYDVSSQKFFTHER